MKALEKLLSQFPLDIVMSYLDDCGFKKDQDWNQGSTSWYLDDIKITIQGTDLTITKLED